VILYQMSKAGIRLKKNKVLDMIWHEESTLVFNKDKFVIGRFADNKLISLDQEAVDLCTKYKFKFDTSLLSSKSEEEEIDEGETEEDTEEGNEDEGGEENAVETASVEAVVDTTSEPSEVKQQEVEEVRNESDNKPESLYKAIPISELLSRLVDEVSKEHNKAILYYNNIVTEQQSQLCLNSKTIAKLEEENNALTEKLKGISKFLGL
jgi:hypothetical protein